jgi:hypothetical protein
MKTAISSVTELPRRDFLRTCALGAGALSLGGAAVSAQDAPRKDYRGPNVIVVRFGGGARRQECTNPDPNKNYTPFFFREFIKQGTFYPNMMIDSFTPMAGVDTSHGQGTLYILTGKYEKFKDIGGQLRDGKAVDKRFLAARFESSVPTLFEYFRAAYDVPEHQALMVNSEDRGDEEFYNLSNHHLYGVRFKSSTLSLRRFKTYLLRRALAEGKFTGRELVQKQRDLKKSEEMDFRQLEHNGQIPELEQFWERWQAYYGRTGFVNPRGDRLLTELTIRAMRELKPRLLMVNYTDCDYVHWGVASHYTQALSIMDAGLKQLVAATEALDEYRGNTVFVVVPDCGRDNNPLVDVPFQHHFNTRSAHEIFCAVVGPGVSKGVVVDKQVDQIQVAGTVGKLMGMKTTESESRILEEAIV